MQAKLNNSWQFLQPEFEKPYFQEIKSFLTKEIHEKQIIYPHPKNFFRALDLCDFENIKVVILWQDPYHGEWQAHWLSFSVPDEQKIPPSLKNIYKEIAQDIGVENGNSGNLESWAEQWVLLLNSTLSVRAKTPNSHSKIGWQLFTDHIISEISQKKSGVVFLLWWSYARQKKTLIDKKKHKILEAPHPSPFSAHSWFFGCHHFSQTNNYLISQGKTPIHWKIS